MTLETFPVRIGIGLTVWAGSYLPMRRMLDPVGNDRPGLLAVGLSAPLGVAALLAWRADPWYRYSVLTICLTFLALYVAVVGLEKVRERSGY